MSRKTSRTAEPADDCDDLPQAPAVDVLTILRALADPVRLEIVRQLDAAPGSGEVTCGGIRIPVSKSTTTHHLGTLARAGVIAERAEGTRKYVRLRKSELAQDFPGLIESVLRAPAAKTARATGATTAR